MNNALHALIDRAYGLGFSLVFLVCSLTTVICVTFLPGQSRRRAVARAAARTVFRITGAWPKIEGLEQIPADNVVVVANHASYLDGILMTAVLPHNFRFVIKREVTQVPVMHFLLRRIGAFFVERFDAQRSALDARRIMQVADDGAALAFFPEGTFRTEPGLRRFHNGAFKIAVRNNMALVPITIIGTRRMLAADRLLPARSRLSVLIHAPVATNTETTDVAVALNQCRETILHALDEPDSTAS